MADKKISELDPILGADSATGDLFVLVDVSGNVTGHMTRAEVIIALVNEGFPDGAEATPSIANKGDLNTGMWFPAADTIAWSKGGAEAMRLSNVGRLGLNTDNPATRVDIIAGGGAQFRLSNTEADAATKTAYIQGRHYLNAEEDVAIAFLSSSSATSTLAIGGGSSILNGVEEINFYTAPDNVTVSPPLRTRINNAGALLHGTTTAGSAGAGDIKVAGNIYMGDTNASWSSGSGTPEGAVTAIVGSMFTRTDGGAGTTLYVKESGAGNTGWVAK